LDIVASNNRSVSANTHKVPFGSSAMTPYDAHPSRRGPDPVRKARPLFGNVILDQLIRL
jgi:hypothetical protein